MHPFMANKFKADWAVGLQQHRRVLARTNRVADAAIRNGDPRMPSAQASADDDAVNIDSPTVTHNYPASPWPWIVLVVGMLLVAAMYYSSHRQVATLPPGPTNPAPAPSNPPAEPGDYIEFY